MQNNFFFQEVGGDQGGSNNSTGGQFFVDPSGHYKEIGIEIDK